MVPTTQVASPGMGVRVRAAAPERAAFAPDLPRVVYIVRSFPRLSQTFVLNELVSIESFGVEVGIVSIVRADEHQSHAQLGSLHAQVTYLSETATAPLRRALVHLTVLARRPARFVRTAWSTLRHRERTSGYHSLGRWEAFDAAVRAVWATGVYRQAAAQRTRFHAHFAHDPTLVAMLVHDLSGARFSFTGHARDLTQIAPAALGERVDKAHDVITICEMNAELLRECSPASAHGKIRLVYNGVDLNAFRPAGDRPDPARLRACTIGRLVDKKGFEILIDAIRLLHEGGTRLELDVYGEGPLRDTLQAQIDAAGLRDAVWLCGARTQQQIQELLPTYDLFALTPYVLGDGDRDGLPTVLPEAMACALPVVTTDVAGVPDLVKHGVNGLVCPPHDSAAVSEALLLLITDHELRSRLGVEARRTVERGFDLAVNTRQLAMLLTGRS